MYCVYRRIGELACIHIHSSEQFLLHLALDLVCPCHHLSAVLSVSGPTEFFAARLQYNEDHY